MYLLKFRLNPIIRKALRCVNDRYIYEFMYEKKNPPRNDVLRRLRFCSASLRYNPVSSYIKEKKDAHKGRQEISHLRNFDLSIFY